ncbi:MAG: tetratricopeptide repeat protein [Candidatus Sumerlaeaceae bacterium]
MNLSPVNRRELKAVGIIWLSLFVIATGALFVLQHNAHKIIYHLQYVSVNRFQKALALYTEAEKRAHEVLRKRETTNVNSASAVAVAASDPDVLAAQELFEQAFATDPRDRFAAEHERYYTMLGDTLGCAGLQSPQLVAYARAAIARRDFSTAQDYLDRVTAKDNADPDLALANAQLAWVSGRKADVENELHKVPPDKWSSDAHLLKAKVLMEAGKLADAATELQSSLKGAKSQVDIRKFLASVYSRLDKPAQALSALEEGRSHGGDSDGNYMHIFGDLLRLQGRTPDAIKALKEAARLEPNSGAVQLSLARAYEAAGQARSASRALQRATVLEPKLQAELLK